MGAAAALVWSMAAAGAAGLVAFGLALAVAWAVLWGDHPWPDWAMPLLGAVAVAAAAAGGGVTFRNVRRRLAGAGLAARLAWLAGGLACLALVAVWAWHEAG